MLDQAKATLAKDQALLANAKIELQRYSKLLEQNLTPEQQYATQNSTVAQHEAAGQNDEDVISAAELNVDYASIKSPSQHVIFGWSLTFVVDFDVSLCQIEPTAYSVVEVTSSRVDDGRFKLVFG